MDIFDTLLDAYRKSRNGKKDGFAKDFVAFARNYFKENPVLATGFDYRGLLLVFRDNRSIPLAETSKPDPQAPAFQLFTVRDTPGLAVDPHAGRTQPTVTVDITGERKE